VLCALLRFLVLFCFITFTPKCFVLAVAAVSAELRAIFQNKISKILQFVRHFVNSAHDSQFCTRWPILTSLHIVADNQLSASQAVIHAQDQSASSSILAV